MNRKLFALLTLLVALLLVSACAIPDERSSSGAVRGTGDDAEEVEDADVEAEPDAGAVNTISADDTRVLLFVNGALGDQSFFDSAQRGLNQAEEEFGIEADIIEAGLDETQWESALIDTVENEEFDVMIVGTFQMVEYLQEIAPQYPDQTFIIFDAPVDYSTGCCDNVYSITYKQNEGSYLAGVYAGAMTTQEIEGMNPESIVAAMGGLEIPVILDFIVGYEQGVMDTNPDATVIRQYVGGQTPWNDPARGRDVAEAQYGQGADIIFQIAAGSGGGVFEAAADTGRYAIGVDSDQALVVEGASPEQAEHILTSMLKNVDNSLYRAIDLYLQGELPVGEVEALGIAEGGVGLARNQYYEENTPDEVKQLVEEAEQAVTNGEIEVATAFE